MKIIDNRDHIDKFEKINGMIDHFRIHFENGNYIEFMIDISILSFLNDIKMYDSKAKLLFTFEKGRPKKSIFIKFLDIFNGVSTKYLNNYLIWNNILMYGKVYLKNRISMLFDAAASAYISIRTVDVNKRPPIPILV